MRPHRRQPTRLPRPWDSPGKNTGVGCRFLLQCMKVKSEREVAQSCLTLATPWTAASRLPRPWDFPGKSTGVGCLVLIKSTSNRDVGALEIIEHFSMSCLKPNYIKKYHFRWNQYTLCRHCTWSLDFGFSIWMYQLKDNLTCSVSWGKSHKARLVLM